MVVAVQILFLPNGPYQDNNKFDKYSSGRAMAAKYVVTHTHVFDMIITYTMTIASLNSHIETFVKKY